MNQEQPEVSKNFAARNLFESAIQLLLPRSAFKDYIVCQHTLKIPLKCSLASTDYKFVSSKLFRVKTF